MTKADRIERIAKEMWRTDPRVNGILWSDGDDGLRNVYRLMASIAITVAEAS